LPAGSQCQAECDVSLPQARVADQENQLCLRDILAPRKSSTCCLLSAGTQEKSKSASSFSKGKWAALMQRRWAKKWDGTVGEGIARDFAGSLAAQRATRGVFITTSKFADSVEIYLSKVGANIVLITGEQPCPPARRDCPRECGPRYRREVNRPRGMPRSEIHSRSSL
jgi:hypothetical protein